MFGVNSKPLIALIMIDNHLKFQRPSRQYSSCDPRKKLLVSDNFNFMIRFILGAIVLMTILEIFDTTAKLNAAVDLRKTVVKSGHVPLSVILSLQNNDKVAIEVPG